ncbi:MAG: hypothetical protein JST95_06385 [Bacteroidetes bacterium]|nr:hypothetical protein [Bacteroidota bacterium]
MRKFITPFFLLILLASCGHGVGSLSGNVFWKYNNYVGNKPDAGSSIHLYPYEKKSKPLEATADVQGNFRFDKVSSGDYLLIVVSENTTASPDDIYRELFYSSRYLKDVFDFDFSTVKPDKQKEFQLQDSLNRNSLTNESVDFSNSTSSDKLLKDIEDRQKKEKQLRDIAQEIIKAIPSDVSSKLGILINKVKLRRVTIEKDKTTTEVIDFGITYI